MTSPLDAHQVRVARAALAKDAHKWSESADVMADAAREAASYSLTGYHIGYFPEREGVGLKYAELQDLVVRLLNEGQEAMREMERALLSALKEYDRADIDAAMRSQRARGEN